MDVRREIEMLRTALKMVRWQLNRIESISFQQRVSQERKRSERHNHHFTIMVVKAESGDSRTLYRRLRQRLRRSDTMGLLPQDGDGDRTWEEFSDSVKERPARVAALLPETDRQAARAAITRLRRVVPDMKGASFGIATYPDDSPHSKKLLELAKFRASG